MKRPIQNPLIKMNKEFKNKAIIVILTLALMFTFTKCLDSDTESKRLKSALSLADLKSQYFEVELNSKKEQLASQKQLILTQEEALSGKLLEIEDLKKYKNIKSKVQYVTNTVIDTLRVPYLIDSNSVELPIFKKFFKYNEKDNWFSLSGEVTDKDVFFSQIKIKNKYSILIADKKMGLFKRVEPTVLLTNFNPYTSTIELNNVQIEYSKPFYKKEWFWFALGGLSGVLIAK